MNKRRFEKAGITISKFRDKIVFLQHGNICKMRWSNPYFPIFPLIYSRINMNKRRFEKADVDTNQVYDCLIFLTSTDRVNYFSMEYITYEKFFSFIAPKERY